MKKRIVSFIITIGILIVSICNFFKELSLLLLVLNSVGFFIFIVILIANMKYVIFSRDKY